MFITLGFLGPFKAEGFILKSEFSRNRATRADAAFIFRNAHETLSCYTKKQFLCILRTFIMRRTTRAITHTLEFLLCRHQLFRGHPLYVLHHLFKFVQVLHSVSEIDQPD